MVGSRPRRRAARLAAVAVTTGALLAPGAAFAAPTFVAASSAATSGSSRSLTISRPPSAAPGDVLVAALDARLSNASHLSAPAGWAVVRVDTNGGGGSDLVQAVYVRVATSFEPLAYTWTFSKYRYAAGAVLVYRGADPLAPIDAHSGRFVANAQSITAPSLTTTVADTTVVGIFGSDGSGSVTPPAGTTERYDVSTKSGSAAVKSAGADFGRASAGATGAVTSVSTSSHRSTIGQLVALRPLGAAAPAPAPGDTTPPAAPTNLAASAPTATSVSLSWSAATDNVGVTGYAVYRDGAAVGTATSTSYTVSGLACGKSYSLAVEAFDAAGNRSSRASVGAATAACSAAPVGAALPPRLAESTGTTFYVAPTGSDSNAGTASAPWRTIQKALNTLQPGQRALVRAGTYVQDLNMSRAGTASAPITVEAYPGERPVLNPVSSHPLRVASTGAYFRFRGFVIEKHPGTSGGNVDVYGHHVEISNNEIRLGTDQGIYTDEASHDDQFLNNRIHHNGKGLTHQSHGIYLQGNDHLVANNVIHDHPKGFGIQVYDRNSRSIVVGNTITTSGHSGIVVGGGGGVDNIRVVNNVLAFNSHYGVSHDSTCPTSSVAHHNVVYGNGWGALQGGCSGLDYSGGNLLADPRFVDYASRDLHLQSGSPAVDAAVADWSLPYDVDDRARPQGQAPDVGACER